MHFLIIGATGRTGSLIVDEALRNNHTVTALVRPSSSLIADLKATPRPGLTLHQGSPLKQSDVEAALARTACPKAPAAAAADAVIIALNARRASDSPFAAMLPDTPDAPWRLVSGATAAVLPAMRAAGTRRLVVMGMQGAGSSWGSLNALFRPLFKMSNMRYQIEDHDAAEALIAKASASGDLPEHVVVRPVMLTEGELAKVKVLGDDGKGACLMPQITRKSVAKFIVEVAAGDEYVGRTPVICN